MTGRWLAPEPRHSARGRLLVRLALPRTARCPSRLAMSVSRIAPPRVLSRARIPNRSWCVSRATSAHRLCRYPRRFRRRQEGRACLDGPNPKIRRDAMGSAPFPPLPTVIRRQAAIPRFDRNRRGLCFRPKPKNESGCPDRRAGARRGKLRPPRPTRSAAPTHHTIPVVKEHPSGQQKKPWWLSNRPELFRLIWKVRFASLPDPLS